MNYLIEALKGSVMGIANIVPGVSGGTMAIIVGIYDKIINAISEVVKHPIKVIKDIWIYIVGIAVGLLIGIVAVSFLLEKAELPTTFLFIGLIVGSIPFMSKRIDEAKIKAKDIVLFIFMILVVVALPFLSLLGFSTDSTNFILLFLVGMIAAGTMIIPGISGSMVLMTLRFL